ncbi:MAG: hypothetical protein E1N59_2563 [Puniceicoccaceae bacterium 5H]|nr:MAG: hypothetical protein E1N59_2563 [Puniceicoccaceae bacterium 5H]
MPEPAAYYWFDLNERRARGPFAREQLEALREQGLVTPESHLARVGEASWQRAREFPELADMWVPGRALQMRTERQAPREDAAPPMDVHAILRDNQSRLPEEDLGDLPHPLWNARNLKLAGGFLCVNVPAGLLLMQLTPGGLGFVVTAALTVYLDLMLVWYFWVLGRH